MHTYIRQNLKTFKTFKITLYFIEIIKLIFLKVALHSDTVTEKN